MKNQKTILMMLCLCLLMRPVTESHAGDSKSIVATTSVVPRCKLEGVSDIRFGSLDPSQSVNVAQSGWIVVACTRGVEYQITVDRGLTFNAQSGLRQMRGSNGLFVLPYSFSPDIQRGEGGGFANPTRVAIRASLLGPAYRDLPADDYIDTLRVILEY